MDGRVYWFYFDCALCEYRTLFITDKEEELIACDGKILLIGNDKRVWAFKYERSNWKILSKTLLSPQTVLISECGEELKVIDLSVLPKEKMKSIIRFKDKIYSCCSIRLKIQFFPHF